NTLTQTPIADGWNNTPVTAPCACSDTGSGVPTCPADQQLSTEGENQTVTGTATDAAGNAATATTIVNVDLTPPVVTLSSPTTGTTGTTVYTPSVTVSGTASDNGSGI